MKMFRFAHLLAFTAPLAALALAGCNDAQKSQVEAAITQACVVGADIGVQVASTTPAGAAIVPFSQIINGATPLACGVLVQAADQAVAAITAAGGTAEVKVTTAEPKALSSRLRMRKLVPGFRGQTITITVPPYSFG